jgi:hypothetical protein
VNLDMASFDVAQELNTKPFAFMGAFY